MFGELLDAEESPTIRTLQRSTARSAHRYAESMKSSLPTFKSPIPTPPKTSSKFPLTARRGHPSYRRVVPGPRSAPRRAGEFTMRAFLNGRLDLTQAEAVRDLIESQTLFQAKVAAQQLEGALSKRIKPIKTKLVALIALLEAGIDFAEDDISVLPDCAPFSTTLPSIRGPLEQLASNIRIRKARTRRADSGYCGTSECRQVKFVQWPGRAGTSDRYRDAREPRATW